MMGIYLSISKDINKNISQILNSNITGFGGATMIFYSSPGEMIVDPDSSNIGYSDPLFEFTLPAAEENTISNDDGVILFGLPLGGIKATVYYSGIPYWFRIKAQNGNTVLIGDVAAAGAHPGDVNLFPAGYGSFSYSVGDTVVIKKMAYRNFDGISYQV
jgi:hypothetical protein